MGGRGLVFALVMLLAACGARDDSAPFTDSRLPPALGVADFPPAGWAWGLIQTAKDAPAQRYGVAAAATAPRAQVLVLPGYGDFAETHYRQLRAFVGQYYISWALDGAGQGGSGRTVGPRDLGHADSFQPDVDAIGAMVRQTIRPAPDTPLVLVAEGTAAPVALRALRASSQGVSGVVLVRPSLTEPFAIDPRLTIWAARLRLGFIRTPGGSGWTHDAAAPDISTDQGRRWAWQAANPDLRMGDPSLGWLAAFEDLANQTLSPKFAPLPTPVLILSPRGGGDPDWAPICRALPHCVLEALPKDATAREIAFVETLVPKDAPVPHPLGALSNDDPQR